jgi:hypothetical protein
MSIPGSIVNGKSDERKGKERKETAEKREGATKDMQVAIAGKVA